MIRRGRPAGGTTRDGERGQSLVEFSMIVPLFLLFLLGLLEFGMVFDHVLTISYASREGARTGAALANGSKMADESLGTCSDVDSYVVAAVERVLDSPGSPVHGDLSNVNQIRIYKATATGTEVGPVNVWTPGNGPTVDGTAAQLPALVLRVGLVHAHQQHEQPGFAGRLDLVHLPRRDAARLADAVLRRSWLDPAPRDRSLRHGAEPDRLEGL